MERIKVYVINLLKDRERRESILKETGQYPYLDTEIVKAVCGKKLTNKEKNCLFDIRNNIRRYGRSVLPGEIGCTLSHLECYRRLLESDCEFALILEDDVAFVEDAFTETFSESVIEFMNNKGPQILLLYADFEYIGKKSLFHGNYSLYSVYSALASTAYLINKSAAQLFFTKGLPYWIADDWCHFRRWGIRISCLYPSVFIHQGDKFDSSIIDKRFLFSYKKLPFFYRLEYRLIYEKLDYWIRKKFGLIKHLQG